MKNISIGIIYLVRTQNFPKKHFLENFAYVINESCLSRITDLQAQKAFLSIPFLANVPVLYPQKKSENRRFSSIFRGCKMGALARNGLCHWLISNTCQCNCSSFSPSDHSFSKYTKFSKKQTFLTPPLPPPVCTCTGGYQEVKNVGFSENFAHVLSGRSLVQRAKSTKFWNL